MATSKWHKVFSLIMEWAQDDGTSDQLMDLVGELGYDPMDPDEFWVEFEKRLGVAFGKPPAKLTRRG